MARVLLAWIGQTDIKAAKGDALVGDGPIAQALAARGFDHVVLLNNYPAAEAALFERWIEKKAKASIVVRQEKLSSPTHHADIYRAVTGAVPWVLAEYGKRAKLTFHLSPGTPAMASIWIIAAKTRFEAELIESSKEAGVRTVDVPFELAAEFIPDAIRRADEDIERLSGGLRPEEPKFGDILHRSDEMKRLVRRARQAAPYSASILIEGESGTGKELLAAAIHKESPRKGHPFVPVNCGAIPKDLATKVGTPWPSSTRSDGPRASCRTRLTTSSPRTGRTSSCRRTTRNGASSTLPSKASWEGLLGMRRGIGRADGGEG
jgi:hypothetical protein